MMLSTLSPGGKVQWIKPGESTYISEDMISNPFIEKSHIVQHKKKIQDIDKKREMIQSMYKNHQTWAQHEEHKKSVRDKYFETKMNESFIKFDH